METKKCFFLVRNNSEQGGRTKQIQKVSLQYLVFWGHWSELTRCALCELHFQQKGSRTKAWPHTLE